jgi:hypothetical protein
MDDEDEDELHGDDDDDLRGDGDHSVRAPPSWGCVDLMLLVFALAMLALFLLVAPRVALAIGVGLVCVSVGAFAWVSAQASEGLSRWLSLIVCGLSVATFAAWSFKYIFYMPEVRTTSGCGGAFFEDVGHHNGEDSRPRDELRR